MTSVAQTSMEAWVEVERAVRARAIGPAVLPPEELRRYAGLDLFRKMIAGELPYPPICDTLGFILIEVDKGRAVFQGTPRREHYNPIGSVHGGFHATLLDSCVGCAVHSTLEAGQGYTTLEIKINYVRALTDQVGPVRAEGRVIHAGRSVRTADGRLVDREGRLYAHTSTTCMVLQL
jgi:uncharacterized protein (TIGR00369 family)